MTDVLDIEDMQKDLQRAKQQIAGSVPLIPQAPDCYIELPRGLYHDGAWQRDALVRELTGIDEEALAKVKGAAFFDAIIAHGVVSLGSIALEEMSMVARSGLLQELLLGERDQLFMKVCEATFGDSKTIYFTCTACEVEQEVDLLLSADFPPKVIDNLALTYSYTTTGAYPKVLKYRLVTGADQLVATAKKGISPAEVNTIILSRVIEEEDGHMVIDPMRLARSLSIRDRQNLLLKLAESQPTIDMAVKTNCSSCDAVQTIILGWGDIFRA